MIFDLSEIQISVKQVKKKIHFKIADVQILSTCKSKWTNYTLGSMWRWRIWDSVIIHIESVWRKAEILLTNGDKMDRV